MARSPGAISRRQRRHGTGVERVLGTAAASAAGVSGVGRGRQWRVGGRGTLCDISFMSKLLVQNLRSDGLLVKCGHSRGFLGVLTVALWIANELEVNSVVLGEVESAW